MALFGKKKEEMVTKNCSVNKQYGFSCNGITLNFSLNIESPEGLLVFKSLMEEAMKEIERDLETFKQS